MQITWFGHAAFRLDFAGHAVLIDPFFTGNPAFVSDRATAIRGISHIVLTHGHADHVGDTLDIPIHLELGAVSETLTVTAETPMLESTNADVGQIVETRQQRRAHLMQTGVSGPCAIFPIRAVPDPPGRNDSSPTYACLPAPHFPQTVERRNQLGNRERAWSFSGFWPLFRE